MPLTFAPSVSPTVLAYAGSISTAFSSRVEPPLAVDEAAVLRFDCIPVHPANADLVVVSPVVWDVAFHDSSTMTFCTGCEACQPFRVFLSCEWEKFRRKKERPTVFDPMRTFTNEPGRLRRQFFVGCRKMIAGVVGAEGAFRGAEEVCDILTFERAATYVKGGSRVRSAAAAVSVQC